MTVWKEYDAFILPIMESRSTEKERLSNEEQSFLLNNEEHSVSSHMV